MHRPAAAGVAVNIHGIPTARRARHSAGRSEVGAALRALPRAAAFAALLTLAPPARAFDTTDGGPDATVLALVHEIFAVLQPKSFAANREYCGFILRDADGAVRATPPVRGRAASCVSRWPEDIGGPTRIIASYHTHAGFVPGDWGEVPSDIDMESDRAGGYDGFVATPGGRLWFIDSSRNTARQLCPPGCVPADPAFVQRPPAIARKYSLDGLKRLFGD